MFGADLDRHCMHRVSCATRHLCGFGVSASLFGFVRTTLSCLGVHLLKKGVTLCLRLKISLNPPPTLILTFMSTEKIDLFSFYCSFFYPTYTKKKIKLSVFSSQNERFIMKEVHRTSGGETHHFLNTKQENKLRPLICVLEHENKQPERLKQHEIKSEFQLKSPSNN